jgi:aminoglycoside phosphotransferase (APT) family kinase protein
MPWTIAVITVTVNTVTVPEVSRSTADLLLATVREATGRLDLEFAAPPAVLSGGFYAEMLRFRLAGPTPELDRDLMARIVPNPDAGRWEATIQRAVAEQGFPTPAVRLVADETSPLGRFVIVMDAVDGEPPMAGLSIRTVAGQIPDLVRHLPDQLARVASELHSLDPEPLRAQLEALDTTFPLTTAEFVEQQVGHATALGRPDLASVGEDLLASEPRSSARVIAHGDLHPFNLLITPDGPELIDWTVARVAHPGFTVGFTSLMLANPPVPLPRVGGALLRPVGRNIARRFLSTYRRLTDGTPGAVDDENLDWHRNVHALRILVELASFDAAAARPTSHPWVILEPVARRSLGLSP